MVSEVSESIGSSISRGIQPTFGYYRQPNGWLTVSPITRFERIKYMEQGWESLEKYGAFDMTAYVANHPFEGLFMFGGAHEMSVDQVIETGLYIEPPLVPTCKQHLTQFHRAHTSDCWRGAKPVAFPQLDGVVATRIGPFPCEFCQRKLPTNQARTQHQQVAHREELGNLQTGASLGNSLAAALGNVKPTSGDPATAALLERIKELEAAQTITEKRRVAMAKARAARRKKESTSVA